MVQSDPTNELIVFLRKEKNPPSSEFVETLLKAFVDRASFHNGSNVSDPISILNFLEIFKATKDLVSKIAQFTEKALHPMTNEEEKNLIETPAIASMLSFSVAPVPSRIESTSAAAQALAEAAAKEKPLENVRSFNCNEIGAGHKLYRCGINCQLQSCPRILSLETKG